MGGKGYENNFFKDYVSSGAKDVIELEVEVEVLSQVGHEVFDQIFGSSYPDLCHKLL